MTGVLKFTKIDFIRQRKVLLLMIAFIILFTIGFTIRESGAWTNHLFAMGYAMFMGIVIASAPFTSEAKSEKGFLQMLPAIPGEQVGAHFIFGLMCILMAPILGMLCLSIGETIGGNPYSAATEMTMGTSSSRVVLTIAFCASLIICGIQSLVFTIARFNSLKVMQILRMIPAFLFLFAFSVGEDVDEEKVMTLGQLIAKHSIVLLIISLAIYLALALISIKIQKSRE